MAAYTLSYCGTQMGMINRSIWKNMLMDNRRSLRSQTLDLLRFPLAVVVLMVHIFSSNGITFQGRRFTFDEYPVFMELNHFIDAFLRDQSVPVYYFISGYVFFLGIEMTRSTYVRKLKNRVRSLFIPYMVWNTLSLLLLISTLLSSFSQYTLYSSSLHISLPNILSCYWSYRGDLAGITLNTYHPVNGPLWFVRNLMVLVLCTPLLYVLVKKLKLMIVFLFGVIWFLSGLSEADHYNLSVSLFFFAWGAYMSIFKKDMLTIFGRYFKSSVFLYLGCGFLYMAACHYFPSAMPFIKQLNIVMGLLFAYNVSAWLLRKKICRVSPFLASASFFIYVSHALIVGKILKLVFVTIRPASEVGLFCTYFFTIGFSVALLLGTFYLLRRYTPRLLKVIAGQR